MNKRKFRSPHRCGEQTAQLRIFHPFLGRITHGFGEFSHSHSFGTRTVVTLSFFSFKEQMVATKWPSDSSVTLTVAEIHLCKVGLSEHYVTKISHNALELGLTLTESFSSTTNANFTKLTGKLVYIICSAESHRTAGNVLPAYFSPQL